MGIQVYGTQIEIVEIKILLQILQFISVTLELGEIL